LHSQYRARRGDIDHSAGILRGMRRGTLPDMLCVCAYVPQSRLPYRTITNQCFLAEHMLASKLYASSIFHQYAIAALSSRGVDYLRSAWDPEGGAPGVVSTFTAQPPYDPISPPVNSPTFAREVYAAGVRWRFCTGWVCG
jgi:hypothetical protein